MLGNDNSVRHAFQFALQVGRKHDSGGLSCTRGRYQSEYRCKNDDEHAQFHGARRYGCFSHWHRAVLAPLGLFLRWSVRVVHELQRYDHR